MRNTSEHSHWPLYLPWPWVSYISPRILHIYIDKSVVFQQEYYVSVHGPHLSVDGHCGQCSLFPCVSMHGNLMELEHKSISYMDLRPHGH